MMRPLHDIVGDVVARVLLAIEVYIVHISVLCAILRCFDYEILTAGKVQCSLLEERGAHNILVRCRAYGVETERREYVPRRGLTVILVATVAVGVGVVHAVHCLAQPVLCLPGFAAVVVHVYHVLDGLVAVGIVTHVHDLHLAYLMNCESIVAVIKMRRDFKDFIQIRIEGIIASHKFDKSSRIMEY